MDNTFKLKADADKAFLGMFIYIFYVAFLNVQLIFVSDCKRMNYSYLLLIYQ